MVALLDECAHPPTWLVWVSVPYCKLLVVTCARCKHRTVGSPVGNVFVSVTAAKNKRLGRFYDGVPHPELANSKAVVGGRDGRRRHSLFDSGKN